MRRMCGADAGCLAMNYQSLGEKVPPALSQRDLVAPIWRDRALFRAKVDGFALHNPGCQLENN
jgi:hypothetical protein